MKLRITVVGEYDVTDDPNELERIYGTSDPAECAKVDQANSPMEILEIADRIIRHEVRPVLGEQPEPLEAFAQWIVALDDPDGPGFEARKSVSMAQIIRKAREALDLPEEF